MIMPEKDYRFDKETPENVRQILTSVENSEDHLSIIRITGEDIEVGVSAIKDTLTKIESTTQKILNKL